MHKQLLSAGACLALLAPATLANDNCATPTAIGGAGSWPVDTTLATNSGLPASCIPSAWNMDVWYAWTATSTGNWEFSLCGSTLVDTVMAIWPYTAGACPLPGTSLACNDDSCSLQSLITGFSAVAGTTYMIQLDTYTSGTTTFTGTLTATLLPPPPANDDCATPTVIGGAGSWPVDTTSAGNSGLPASCVTTAWNRDVWFAWTATTTGNWELSLCGSTTVDTVMAVWPYTAGACPLPGTSLACNDNGCGTQSRIYGFPAVAGTTYMIQLDTYTSGTTTFTGLLTATLLPPPPANDSCLTPTAISGSGTFPVTNVGAFDSARPPSCATTSFTTDVWFAWLATASGWTTVSTCAGTTADTVLAVWPHTQGACPTVGTSLVCNDNACGNQSSVTFLATAGTTYLLQFGGYLGATWTGTFDVGPAAINDCEPTGSARPELEPNGTKPEATAALGLVAGDFLSGTTTGGTSTAGDTALTSSDVFRVRLATLPAGIYRHQIALRTSGTTGHTGTIRGLNQTSSTGSPGIIGTIDSTFQSSSTASLPPRMNAWYGFGRGEELYYRISGSTSTTAPYQAILCTAAVTTTDVAGTFAPGLIVMDFENQGHSTDTDIHLFDGTRTVIDDANNDDNSIAGGGSGAGLQSRLQRTLTAGDYYLAIGRFNTATNDNAPADDDYRTGMVLDFPDAIAGGTTTAGGNVAFQISDGTTTSVVAATHPASDLFPVVFYRFTVGTAGPPITSFCFGDGSGTACPCGNTGIAGNGCASSVNPNGANLAGSGAARIAADTFVLSGTGMPNSSALYFQGTAQTSGGAGAVFGDGKRCAAGSIVRLGTKVNAGGASQYPVGADPSISVRGLNSAGATRTYQVWYRNAAVFCTPSTFNLTNGVQVTWAP